MGNPSFSGSMLVFGGEWCVFTICCLSFAIFLFVVYFCIVFCLLWLGFVVWIPRIPFCFRKCYLEAPRFEAQTTNLPCVVIVVTVVYGTFTYIWLIWFIYIYICIFMVNVGKYTSPMDPSWVVVTVVNGKDGRFFRGDFARWRPWEFHAVWMWQLVVDIPWPSLRGAVPWMVWRFLFLCKVFKLKKTMVPVYSPGKLPYKKSNQNVGKPCCRCCHHL